MHELPIAIDPVQPLLLAGTVNAVLLEAIELKTKGALPQLVTCTFCDVVA
jgi:hypothetical protein